MIHAQGMTRNVELMVAHERAVISKNFGLQDLRNRWMFRRRSCRADGGLCRLSVFPGQRQAASRGL